MLLILQSLCFLIFACVSLSLQRAFVSVQVPNYCKSRKLFHHVDRSNEISFITFKTPLLFSSVKYIRSIFTASALSLSLLCTASPALALDPLPPIPEALRMGKAPSAVNEPTKLSDGVEYFDIVLGDGEEAKEGRSVQFLWVLRRSNGYFVASSASDFANEPFIYRLGNRQKVIIGVDEAIRGMRVGGIRRVSIPPNAAFIGVDDSDPGPLPKEYGPRRQILTRKDREVWKMEIKLLKVK